MMKSVIHWAVDIVASHLSRLALMRDSCPPLTSAASPAALSASCRGRRETESWCSGTEECPRSSAPCLPLHPCSPSLSSSTLLCGSETRPAFKDNWFDQMGPRICLLGDFYFSYFGTWMHHFLTTVLKKFTAHTDDDTEPSCSVLIEWRSPLITTFNWVIFHYHILMTSHWQLCCPRERQLWWSRLFPYLVIVWQHQIRLGLGSSRH